MRLNRLGLAAFGKFTDANLDFGDKPTDGPDLHILYGPNEAGKSTIYAAMLDFFFGIDSSYFTSPKGTSCILPPRAKNSSIVSFSIIASKIYSLWIRASCCAERRQKALLALLAVCISWPPRHPR